MGYMGSFYNIPKAIFNLPGGDSRSSSEKVLLRDINLSAADEVRGTLRLGQPCSCWLLVGNVGMERTNGNYHLGCRGFRTRARKRKWRLFFSVWVGYTGATDGIHSSVLKTHNQQMFHAYSIEPVRSPGAHKILMSRICVVRASYRAWG